MRTCRDIASAHSDLEAARLLETNGEVWRRYWPTVAQSWTLGVVDGATISHEAWRRTLSACGCDDASLARTAKDTHWRHRRDTLRLYPDVHDVLPSLRRRHSIALVTNGASDTQRANLRVLGIERYFEAIVISGEVGVAKPDRRIFGMALRELGVEPENVWHIGDDLRTDVAGAHAAGLTAVWLNRSGRLWSEGDPEGNYEIRSLTALPGLLQRPSC